MCISDFEAEYLAALKETSREKRTRLLADLMSQMERTFSIPMLMDTAWARDNSEVLSLYRMISTARDL